jgi:hypothetical protein
MVLMTPSVYAQVCAVCRAKSAKLIGGLRVTLSSCSQSVEDKVEGSGGLGAAVVVGDTPKKPHHE